MPSAFPAWIRFTYCVLNSWIWIALGQGASYPKPSVELIPSKVIIKGGNFTICCSTPSAFVKLILYQGTQVKKTLYSRGNEGEFHFTNAKQEDSGTYTCRYNPTSDGSLYSDASDTIEIEVRETFPKPSLQVRPGNVAVRGGTLTFRCTGEQANMRFILRYRGTTELQKVEPLGKEAEFTTTDVQQKDEGSYDCYYQTKSAATVYSASSNSIDIRVRDLPRASISFESVPGVKGDYKIWCLAPETQTVHRFFLYKDGAEAPLTDRNVAPGQHSVTFPVSDSNAQTCQRCRCSYQIMESGVPLTSPLSNLVFLASADDERTTPKFTETSSDDEETNAPNSTANSRTNNQTILIISVVCAALLLFFLLVIAVLYSRRRQKKTKGDIQTKDLCSSEEKTESATETMYATDQKRKSPDATNVPEVRESEESDDQEGLTYVTINQEAHKKKRPTQPRSDQDTTVYAAINLH